MFCQTLVLDHNKIMYFIVTFYFLFKWNFFLQIKIGILHPLRPTKGPKAKKKEKKKKEKKKKKGHINVGQASKNVMLAHDLIEQIDSSLVLQKNGQ